MTRARESWVRPPLLGAEAPPAWRAVWRFRLVLLLALAVLVLLFVLAYRELSGANGQDPGVSEDPAVSLQVPAAAG